MMSGAPTSPTWTTSAPGSNSSAKTSEAGPARRAIASPTPTLPPPPEPSSAAPRATASRSMSADGFVVVVVAEVTRARQSQPLRGTPARVARRGDDRHPQSVTQRLGGHRLAGLAIQDADQIGHARDHLAVAAGDQVLV